jgi:hypothetical protein
MREECGNIDDQVSKSDNMKEVRERVVEKGLAKLQDKLISGTRSEDGITPKHSAQLADTISSAPTVLNGNDVDDDACFLALDELIQESSTQREIENLRLKIDQWDNTPPVTKVEKKLKEEEFPVIDMLVSSELLPKAPTEADFSWDEKAMREYLWYLRCEVVCCKSQMLSVVRDFYHNLYHTGKCSLPYGAKVVDCRGAEKRWLYKSPVSSELGHSFGIHVLFKEGKEESKLEDALLSCKLVPLLWRRDRFGVLEKNEQGIYAPTIHTQGGVYIVTDDTYLLNNLKIYNKLRLALKEYKHEKDLEVELIDGVPGCGKSTWILENAKLEEDMVLAPARESIDDLRFRFTEKRIPQRLARERVRTVDSFFLRLPNKPSRVKNLHFDEALMTHAGTVVFAAAILGVDKVICQGDRKQIPFINRVMQKNLKYHHFERQRLEANLVTKRVTYRSPVDVAHYFNKKRYYDGEPITTKNKVMRSMVAFGPRSPKPFSGIGSLPLIPGMQYLCFTQAEKEEVAKQIEHTRGAFVNTVHEAQGKTYPNVSLVRLRYTENEIYPGGAKSEPYTIVAMSRHTRAMIYYTAIEDKLYCDIQELMRVQENQLLKSLFDEEK